MSLRAYLRPEAEADIEEAAAWYEKQLEGLGYEFLDEVLSVFETISCNPSMYVSCSSQAYPPRFDSSISFWNLLSNRGENDRSRCCYAW